MGLLPKPYQVFVLVSEGPAGASDRRVAWRVKYIAVTRPVSKAGAGQSEVVVQTKDCCDRLCGYEFLRLMPSGLPLSCQYNPRNEIFALHYESALDGAGCLGRKKHEV
jgi:hypothetical protein